MEDSKPQEKHSGDLAELGTQIENLQQVWIHFKKDKQVMKAEIDILNLIVETIQTAKVRWYYQSVQ